MSYPFDPDVRRYVTDLLYELLPALYRIRDLPEGATEQLKMQAPEGTEELYKFLHVLATPLAEVRENVEELHADLFIDKCADWVLPYLAEMVGMQLVFPDARSQRLDVRGTVQWRRRKGTPAMLQEMGSELAGQMVVTQEGFKRLLLTQDLNLLRSARAVVRIDDGIVSDQTTGQLDATFHALDPRRIGVFTGRYHPKHITHWTHATRLFPLREGTAFNVTQINDNDLRYAFHPLGWAGQLRVRRATPMDRVPTDLVPRMHFAAQPGDYFDQDGHSNARFTARLTGLPAGVAAPVVEPRAPSATVAAEALVRTKATVLVLDYTTDRLMSDVDIEVCAVPLQGGSKTMPDTGQVRVRGGVRISQGGVTCLSGTDLPMASPAYAMLRLRPRAPGDVVYFPGATLEISGLSIDARLGALDSDRDLATLGFLRGALVVEVPATWIDAERWFYVAADGSVYDAQSANAAKNGQPADIALENASTLSGDAITVGCGPAWPPLPRTSNSERFRGIPCAPGRGPFVVHGGRALVTAQSSYSEVGPNVTMALVFAARTKDGYEPFVRLNWKGGDPTKATGFSWLDREGKTIASPNAYSARMSAVAGLLELGGDVELLIRLEADVAGIVLPPCEVVYTSAMGETLLIYLPALETGAATIGVKDWPPSLSEVGFAVAVGVDGATFVPGAHQVERYASGAVIPIREAASLRRRRVRQRDLSAGAVPKRTTRPGWLDIDPVHGLFALAQSEPPPKYTQSLEGLAESATVTVDMQDGYSDHIGARNDAREPILDRQQPKPTRVVMGSGRFHRQARAESFGVPRYATLSAALAAIANGPVKTEPEVIQFEDSATYTENNLAWPAKIKKLVIQAAEFERPVLILGANWTANPVLSYDEITLRGLMLDPRGFVVNFPKSIMTHLEFCTVAKASGLVHFAASEDESAHIDMFRSILGRIRVDGEQTMSLVECIVDAAGGMAIDAQDAVVEMDRVTVVADVADPAVRVCVLEATETLFADRVEVRDRFHGCVRYSRVAPGSKLPRKHRVVEDEPQFVTRDREDPAHLRLAEICPRSVLRGAADGSEFGVFHDVRLAQRTEALQRRLIEYTPVGLSTGILRSD